MALPFERSQSLFTNLKFLFIVTLTEPTTPLNNAHQGGSFFVHLSENKDQTIAFLFDHTSLPTTGLSFPIYKQRQHIKEELSTAPLFFKIFICNESLLVFSVGIYLMIFILMLL